MRTITAAALAALALAACGAPPPPPAEAPAEGREETRGIRNTENIGVSGDAIADKVDGALQAHDERNEELRKAEEAAEQ